MNARAGRSKPLNAETDSAVRADIVLPGIHDECRQVLVQRDILSRTMDKTST